MSLENRQSDRRAFGQRAWVKMRNFGIESLVPCTIADVSAGDARLSFRSARDAPDCFGLHLSPTSQTPKRCRVVWRARDAVGVVFTD
jgi:hypothetical protein